MQKLDELVKRISDKELMFEIDILIGDLGYRAERNGFVLGIQSLKSELAENIIKKTYPHLNNRWGYVDLSA